MNRIALALLVFGAFVSVPARAEVVEIPLPSLHGEYNYDTPGSAYRVVTVQLPGAPAVIHGASMRIRGSATTGVIYCDGPVPNESPWVTNFFARLQAGTHQYWSIEDAPWNAGGPFAWSTSFDGWSVFGAPLPTWGFLMDGSAQMEFGMMDNNVLLGCWGITPPPKATIEEAVFIIDADFAVPTTGESWGRIKQTYR